MRTEASVPSRAAAGHVPGEPGVWIFILGDMLVFAILFLTFLSYRGQEPDLFAVAQAHLNRHYGIVNTLLLLTSSWFMAAAVDRARVGRPVAVARLMAGTLICGAGFLAVKTVEYGEKIAGDQAILANDFFMFYFVMTGLHLLHLILGMVFLVFIRRRILRQGLGDGQFALLETGASFWHLVDLLWIILFPLLYLVH